MSDALAVFTTDVFTVSQMDEKIKRLASAREFLFTTQIDLTKKLEEVLAVEEIELVKKTLPNLEPRSLTDFFQKVTEYFIKMPKVTITFAKTPNFHTVKKASLWLKQETGKKYLIDIKTDPSIVAGVIIEHGGRRSELTI